MRRGSLGWPGQLTGPGHPGTVGLPGFVATVSHGVLFRRRLAAILDRGGLDLDALSLESSGEGLVGEGHLLAQALIRPVLPGGVQVDGVRAARERLAAVVLAVPDDGVFPGRAGRPRDR